MGAIATGAANDVVNQVNTLAGAGARTIVVLSLPDIGLAPNFNTSPASPLATFSVSTFNTTLKNGLATIASARPGTRILQVNIAGLFSAAIANPSAFGFANVTNQCLTTVACVTASQAVQTPTCSGMACTHHRRPCAGGECCLAISQRAGSLALRCGHHRDHGAGSPHGCGTRA